MPSPRWQVAVAHLALFLGPSFVWMMTINLGLAVWMMLDGRTLVDPTEVIDWLGPAGFGGFTILQMSGFAVLAVGLSTQLSAGDPAFVSRPEGAEDLRARLRRAFPLSMPVLWIAVATLGGLTIWTFPSWIAQLLVPLFPDYESTNEMLTRLLRTAPPGGRAVVVAAIVGSAPLFEELIFRGYLWRVLEAGLGTPSALIGTTLLFAAFHLDPVQGVALLPIALFLGWLRWRSGSLAPSIVTHLINNGLGVALLFLSSAEEEPIGLGVAFGGLGATLAVAAIGQRLSRWSGPASP